MRIGNFSVDVVPGRELSGGHIEMEHGRQYELMLRNDGHVRCDAEISVDGKDLGGYRVNAHSSWRLERGSNDRGKFTFYRAGSSEAAQAGLGAVSDSQLGVISVRFRPERQQKVVRTHSILRGQSFRGSPQGSLGDEPCYGASSLGDSSRSWDEEKTSGGISFGAECRNLSAGGTGLSGYSNQDFVTVANLEYDLAGEVTINLRLVCGVAEPRPLQPVGNPVPHPVARGY